MDRFYFASECRFGQPASDGSLADTSSFGGLQARCATRARRLRHDVHPGCQEVSWRANAPCTNDGGHSRYHQWTRKTLETPGIT